MSFNALLIGGSGTGKSWVGVNLIHQLGGHGIVLDSERSCRLYHERFKFQYPGGKLDHCPSIMEAHAVVKDLLSDPTCPSGDPCRLLFCDSTTPWYNNLQDQIEEFKHAKKGKQQFESALDQDAWGTVKRLHRRFTADLRRLEIPVICTARAKEEWEGAGDQRRRVGVIPEGQKGFEHEFDLVINMSSRGSTFRSTVAKSRVAELPQGTVLSEPLHKVFLDTFPSSFQASAPKPRATDEQVAEFQELVDVLKLEHNDVREGLRTRGVSQFEDLSPDQATSILEVLNKQRQEQTVTI